MPLAPLLPSMVASVTRLVASAELLCVAEELVGVLLESHRISRESAQVILGDLPQLKEDIRRQTESNGDVAQKLMDRVEVILQFLLLNRDDLCSSDIAKLDRLRNAIRS